MPVGGVSPATRKSLLEVRQRPGFESLSAQLDSFLQFFFGLDWIGLREGREEGNSVCFEGFKRN